MRKRSSAPRADARQESAATPLSKAANVLERVRIRRARAADVALIIELDQRVTGIAKPDYWTDIFERYGSRRLAERFFLVAEPADSVKSDQKEPLLGYIIGEVRAWEFGSAPCGWVFAFSVDAKVRQQRIGEQLFEAISAEFKKAGIRTMRTMVARDNQLHLAFFRGEGMMAGRYIQLEKDLE